MRVVIRISRYHDRHYVAAIKIYCWVAAIKICLCTQSPNYTEDRRILIPEHQGTGFHRPVQLFYYGLKYE